MRDRNKLLPEVKAKLEELETLSELNKIHFIVTQTLRSEEEQQAYYAQGRESLDTVNEFRKIAKLPPITERENKSVITRAKTVFDSFHAYGMAFDVAIINSSGKVDWSEDADWNSDGISDWVQLGKLGESVGLEWGGNFSSLRDLPHFQYRMGKSLAELKQEINVS
jgi:peptidoglycan L-alanyl-D-glutamate endopeptidase CwlK